MIDFTRPETWTALGLLIAAVLAFWRGDVIPVKTHDKICAQLKENQAQLITELREVIKKQEAAIEMWREMALRGTNLAEKSIDVAQTTRRP